VNKTLDFVKDKFPITLLYPGHKPISVMIDIRDKKEFNKIKANKDVKTLKVEIYKTLPVLLRQIRTQISSWIASVHKIR
jgi:hypothetical protein